jgi:mono/diheme cytochrome c family protein
MSRAIVVAAAVLLSVTGLVAGPIGQDAAQKRTTKDGVFTKAQADTGKASFEKTCASCHSFQPSSKSDVYPDLAGEAFLTKWNGRSARELITLIFTTMPNDGSAFLTEAQAADLAAYVLQQNGFPVGQQPLKADASADGITIVK